MPPPRTALTSPREPTTLQPPRSRLALRQGTAGAFVGLAVLVAWLYRFDAHGLGATFRAPRVAQAAAPWRGDRTERAERQRPTVAEVKAVLLFNLIKYTDWPESALGDPEDPFVVTVIGVHPFERHLEETFANKRLHGRRIEVIKLANLPETVTGHLVFVGGVDQPALLSCITASRNQAMLLVGEQANFCLLGGFVRLYQEGKKQGIEIRIDRLEDTGLSMQVELLKLAKIFKEPPAKRPIRADERTPGESGLHAGESP